MKFTDFIETVKGVYPDAQFPKFDASGFTVYVRVELAKPGASPSTPAGDAIMVNYYGNTELVEETIVESISHCNNITNCDLSKYLNDRKAEGFTRTCVGITMNEKQ